MDPSEIVAGVAPPAARQEDTWSQEDVRQHKEAIIGLLAPGETVLDALRRLRSTSGTQPGRRTARTVPPENRSYKRQSVYEGLHKPKRIDGC